jgi:hypothetical protein
MIHSAANVTSTSKDTLLAISPSIRRSSYLFIQRGFCIVRIGNRTCRILMSCCVVIPDIASYHPRKHFISFMLLKSVYITKCCCMNNRKHCGFYMLLILRRLKCMCSRCNIMISLAKLYVHIICAF